VHYFPYDELCQTGFQDPTTDQHKPLCL